MYPVDSLLVACVTSRETALDQLSALRWACSHPHHIVLVDRAVKPCLQVGRFDGYTVVRPEARPRPGFDELLGLRSVLTADAQFGQAILLDEATLPIGRGLDAACSGYIKQGAGLVGVEDRLCYYESFRAAAACFSEWELPHELWEEAPSPKTPAPGFCVLSAGLVMDLFHRNLLPPDTSHWPLEFSQWISWVAQLLNYTQTLYGHMDRPQPPFYVNTTRGRYLPPPMILAHTFLVYRSLDHVTGYAHRELRAGYKRMREG